MPHLRIRSRKDPFPGLAVFLSILLAIAAIPAGDVVASPAARPTAGARPQSQACQAIDVPAPDTSGFRRDVTKFADETTLANGTVVGYDTYWYPEPDSTADLFRATTSDDALFQAADSPGGTSLGTVWDELCPVLLEMGSIVDQGPGPGDSIEALMTIPVDGGGESWGVARLQYGYGMDVPVLGLLVAPADTFPVALGDASGLGFNGMKVFEDIDADAVLATLEGGAAPAQETGGQEATLGSGTVVTWADPWGDPYIEPNSVNLVTADTTVFNVEAYPATGQTLEDAVALTPESEYTVFDSGPDVNGGLYQLSGLSMLDPMLGEVRTWFVYSRVWPSADGEWIITTQLQSVTPFFTRDMASIPGAITLDGEPLWADLDVAAIIDTVVAAGIDMSSEEPVPSGTQGSGTTTRAETPTTRDTPAGAGEFESVNGTVFTYPPDWSVDPDMSSPDGIQLLAGDATLVVGDFAEDLDPEAVFNQLSSGLAAVIDQGPTPDGGYYGLALGQDNAGRDVYMFFRYLYAKDTGTPVILVLAAPADSFADSLALAHGVTANGQPVLEGLDDAATIATFENGGPTGAAIFTGGQASGPVPTEEPTPLAVSGNEITGPAGTLFAWSDAWTYEQVEGMPPSAVILYGVEHPASIMLFEGGAGQGVDELWDGYSSTGGQVLDEGQSPDGGYYEISYNDVSDSPIGSSGPGYTLTRAYAAEPAPILVSVMITGEDFEPSLEAARDVTTNGISILEGVDDEALIAVFEEQGSTGTAIFTGEEPSTPGTSDQPGDNPQTTQPTSPRDIIARVPTGGPEPTPVESDEGSSYTSELYGYVVEWHGQWEVYDDWTEVDPETGYDTLALRTPDDSAAIVISGVAWDDQYSVDDYVTYWSSEEYLSKYQPEGTEVILADASRRSGAVVLVGPASEDDDEPWVTVFEVQVIDRELEVDVSFFAPVDGFGTAYEDALASVTLDGDEAIGYFSTDEIVAALP